VATFGVKPPVNVGDVRAVLAAWHEGRVSVAHAVIRFVPRFISQGKATADSIYRTTSICA
jgi:hypothetical protein